MIQRCRTRVRSWSPLAGVVVIAGMGALGCASGMVVDRRADGAWVDSRYIPPAAYRAYLEGKLAEENKRWNAAKRAYLRVLEVDPRAAAAMTALGRVACSRASDGDPWREASAWFARAHRLLPGHVPTLLAWARCAWRTGHDREAIRWSREAMKIAPESWEASFLLASALERNGQVQRARHVRQGWEAWSGRQWSQAKVGRDVASAPTRWVLSRGHISLLEVDETLKRGDETEIRRLVSRCSMSPEWLAVRAAALGAWQTARKLGEPLYRSDPSRADAWAAVLAVASVGQHPVRGALMHPPPQSLRHLSFLGRLVAADALVRLGRPGLASTVLGHAGRDAARSDPVARQLWRRLTETGPLEGDVPNCPLP